MQSPLVFGQLAGMAQQHQHHLIHQQNQQQQQQQQSMSLSLSQQSQGQGQSPYNALAQYLTSPLAQTQTIADQSNANGSGNGSGSVGSQDGEERKKWMLATGLGGLFTPGTWLFLTCSINGGVGSHTPGPSGEMIPQARPEHMSPMQLEMLAREGFDTDVSVPFVACNRIRYEN